MTVVHEPLRVLYAIEPRNFPNYQVARVADPQLLAGNTIVLKHAKNVPGSALMMHRHFDEAGFPTGVVTNPFASIEATEQVLAHPFVRGEAPTGSERAGVQVAAAAVEHGATAEELGKPVPNQGAFFQPTILANVTSWIPAYRTEFFGPVSLVFRAADEDEAVAEVNSSPYGLGGSVFTRDTAQGERIARRMETGMVFINHPTMVKADIPFGGVKLSGYETELTEYGIREFFSQKVIDVVDIDAPF